MKAYGYLRVSTKGQMDGHGFDRQQDTIQKYCEGQGIRIAQYYKEQASGKSEADQREQFTSMVESILTNGVRTIVVESLDRLAREFVIQQQLLTYLISKDIHLINASTGENVTEALSSEPMRKAIVQMQGIFAELDRSLLVNKLRKARERIRAEKGRCEGRKPFYDKDIIKAIRRLRTRRKQGMKRMTYKQVAEKLNKDGVESATGRPFTDASVRKLMSRAKKKS